MTAIFPHRLVKRSLAAASAPLVAWVRSGPAKVEIDSYRGSMNKQTRMAATLPRRSQTNKHKLAAVATSIPNALCRLAIRFAGGTMSQMMSLQLGCI